MTAVAQAFLDAAAYLNETRPTSSRLSGPPGSESREQEPDRESEIPFTDSAPVTDDDQISEARRSHAVESPSSHPTDSDLSKTTGPAASDDRDGEDDGGVTLVGLE